MPDRKLNADRDTVDYVLNTYHNYIDNLQITELKNILSKDTHDYDDETIENVINSIMQLIVDECGSDIVNDLNLPRQGDWGYYRGVIFNDHVDIRRDNINDSEFAGAKFADGVTVYSKKLNTSALSAIFMNGVVDLTNVVELGRFNLSYWDERNYTVTVKLSKNLKKIEPLSFSYRLLDSVIEYSGTVYEFNDLIFENFLSWSDSGKNYFNDAILEDTEDTLRIKCLDGDWDHEVFKHDQRYHEWAN